MKVINNNTVEKRVKDGFKRLREEIKRQNLTMADMAARIGVQESSLYYMFSAGTMKLTTAVKIAEVLDVSLCDFIQSRPNPDEVVRKIVAEEFAKLEKDRSKEKQ